ncbi:MAG: hypothetical protein KME27_09435 [Lyngbya sp. HA4199-MV5]|nr:hypothetical protein [Lyngbya sp. HA4199-MV5]
MESRPQKLLDQVREAIRIKHYSYRTEVRSPKIVSPILDFFHNWVGSAKPNIPRDRTDGLS